MEVHQFKQVVTRKVCPTCGQEFRLADEDSVCPKDGAMLAPIVDDSYIGQTLADNCQIIEMIGAGAYGTVYKAKQMPLDRTVAVKIMQQQLVSDLDKVRRFEREAWALSQLVHSNVVGIYDYGLLPCPFMIMEYVDGLQLADFMSRGKIPFDTIIGIATQICSALEAAHAQNIIHRDLKPTNIMLTGNDDSAYTVKVLDFGLAKLAQDNDIFGPALTKSGEIIGSPPYMSPEQCLGKPLDSRSDIYTLGCILYEMLTGQRPFTANSAAEYMNKHCLEAPAPFLEVNSKLVLPQKIQDVVLKALAKEPENRYQTMAELHADLEKSLKIAISSGVGILKKKRKVYRTRVIAMLSTVAAISGAVFIWQCFPQALPETLWKQSFDAGEKALNERDYAYAEDQFKKAVGLSQNLIGKDKAQRHFASLLHLLDAYKKQGKWTEAAVVNDQLLEISKIEDKKKRYGGAFGRNGLAFYFPSKWFILKGDTNWNDGSRFRAAQVLRWGELQVQIYRDNIEPAELANLEQKLYSKLCRKYKLISEKTVRIAGGNADGFVKDFEIDGDFAVAQKNGKRSSNQPASAGASKDSPLEPLEVKSWETGEASLHRHVYFGKPGRIFKIRMQGDRVDFPHLVRVLDAGLATVEFIETQPINVNNRADLSVSSFYLPAKESQTASAICIVPPGAKPLPGYDKKLDLTDGSAPVPKQ